MRLATWNVNSARARLARLQDWLPRRAPDVVCLQETKCLDDAFPREEIEALGYHAATFGQRTYNGVAILSREPPADVVRGLPGDPDDHEARVVAATVGDLRVLSVYAVNGVSVGHDRYHYKLAWLGRLADYARALLADFPRLVVTGDFNVTFDDRDVHDPDAWRERILCSTPEREALARVLEPGLHDAFRKHHEEGGHYTWWDFRTRGFSRDRGLRIDHFLMSGPAHEACTDVTIDRSERGAERPSDHAPVLAELAT